MNQRIDQLSRDDIKAIQRTLIREKYMPPLLGSREPADDGLWGPVTARANAKYWSDQDESSVPVVSPAPSMPWWTSRGMWGPLLTMVSVAAGFAGMGFDAAVAATMIDQIIQAAPLFFAAVGGFMAWWGRKNAQAPVDPTLVARVGTRDIRLPMLAGSKRAPSDPFGHFGE